MHKSLDLRYILIVVINLVKSGESMKWDLFTVVTDPNGLKTCLVFVASLLISFVSVRFSLISPVISVRPQRFSPVMLICFLASLILPQLIFWYLYPIICFASTDCAASAFAGFVQSVQAYFLLIPCLTISITTAHMRSGAVGPGPDPDPDQETGQPTTTLPADPDEV